MDKQRRNFTLSVDVIELLDKQTNKSGTVEEALKLFFKHKDTVRRLAGSVERIEEQLTKQPERTIHNSYEQTCCELQRPDPETKVVPCKHWFWQDGEFRNVLTGELIEV